MYKFIKELEKDIRRESNMYFMFEDINQEYKDNMTILFNSLIQETITSAVSYKIQSEKVIGIKANEQKEALIEQSKAKFNQFNKLVSYASLSGVLNEIEFTTEQDIIESARNYEDASKIANKEGDTKTRVFLESLMDEDLEFYDKQN